MTPRTLPFLLLGALALAGAAEAEWYEGKPDCPPDQMCTMSESSGNDTVTRGPEDCEYCRNATGEDAADDGAPDPGSGRGETCMDGADEGEDCRDDVTYMYGDGPADSGPSDADGDVTTQDGSSTTKDTPGLALAGVVAAAGLALALRRR